MLRAERLSGARVVVALASGPEFIIAFVACLLAGAVAVPSPPLSGRDLRAWKRMEALARDSRAHAVIASQEMTDARERPEFGHLSVTRLRWISPCSDIVSDRLPMLSASPGSIAFLQYTSGSTSDPKGVVITHDNLVANLTAIGQKLRVTKESVPVSWLPMHHDWGLIGVVLAGLFHGNRLVLMAPLHFAQKPLRWLKAITAYSGTHTGAPNFAYELCTKRISPHDLKTLDLRSWKVAGCGAEPIRAQSVLQFCAKFKHSGFKSSCFYPCYGLAEATLFVSGGDGPREPSVLSVYEEELSGDAVVVQPDGSGKLIVGCGSPADGHEILIVDPELHSTQPDGRVGEIWVRGPSVSHGYWASPEGSKPHNAVTADGQDGFLRTGDLGFLREGELFLVGRLKEVIIVNGRKIHPQDIEWSATNLEFPGVLGRAAAFCCGSFEEPQLTILLEMKSAGTASVESLPQLVMRKVARDHDVTPKRIAIVKAGVLPITTSGKLQRAHARSLLLAGNFHIHAEYFAT